MDDRHEGERHERRPGHPERPHGHSHDHGRHHAHGAATHRARHAHAAPREPREPEPEVHHPVRPHAVHKHPEPKPLWPWIAGSAALLLVIPFAFKMLGGGSYYAEESAAAITTRAAEHLQRGELLQARSDIELALLRSPQDETRITLDDLKAKVDAQIAFVADKPSLDLATKSVEAMRELQTQYPAGKRPLPVIRELARTSKAWLDRFAAVAKKHETTAKLVSEVQLVQDSNRALAQLDRPDDAADVLFAVDRRLAVANPQFFEAVRQIDDYVNSHPNDPKLDDLRSRRSAIVETARTALETHEASAKSLLAEKKIADAQKHLEGMRRAAAVEATWNSRADAVEAEILRAGK